MKMSDRIRRFKVSIKLKNGEIRILHNVIVIDKDEGNEVTE